MTDEEIKDSIFKIIDNNVYINIYDDIVGVEEAVDEIFDFISQTKVRCSL